MYHIPVAYATANDYEYTIVSIMSILFRAKENTFYEFYILVDNGFKYEDELIIKKYFDPYKKKCSVTFVSVGETFKRAYLNTDFIKNPTYYRLLLPQLLEEEKCIYLDSDTIVCTDLQELYDICVKDYYIAGVKAPGYIAGGKKDDYCKQAFLPDIKQYVNAGVLLMNLKQMRKDNLVKEFMRLYEFDMWGQDQDIINSACYGRIAFLPFEYNVMTKYSEWKISMYEGIFLESELKRAWNNPKIIHYADRVKPWNALRCAMGDHWWSVCRMSCMWDFFYHKMSEAFFFEAIYHTGLCKNKITGKKTYELFDLFEKEEIIIYGAGNRATQLIIYFKKHNIVPELILVSNKNLNPDELEGIEVKELGGQSKFLTGKVIIIATLEKYHTEIFDQLLKYRFKEIIPLCDSWE